MTISRPTFGKRACATLLNWVGVAIGGSHHQTVDIAVSALSPFSGPAQASLFGRRERFDIMNAAFINGVSSHIFDYDDTHLKTIIHPAGPVASAILALSEMQPVSGKEFLNALVLGVETECRIGNARLSEPLRRRLAHHRHRGRVRIGGGRRQIVEAQRAADSVGAGAGRIAAGGPARILRLDEQELQSGPRCLKAESSRRYWRRRTSPPPTA